ncbi:MAG: hypothetical protein R2697_04495 [Ilumatobacteraceae bacterium]
MDGVEVVDAKEQTDAPRVLPPNRRHLFVTIGDGEQQTRLRPGRARR